MKRAGEPALSVQRRFYSLLPIVTDSMFSTLSGRCTTVTLLRIAHGIICRCSGTWCTCALCSAIACRIISRRLSAFGLDGRAVDQRVELRIDVAPVVEKAIACLVILRAQHRLTASSARR